jgi:hypothetical protein
LNSQSFPPLFTLSNLFITLPLLLRNVVFDKRSTSGTERHGRATCPTTREFRLDASLELSVETAYLAQNVYLALGVYQALGLHRVEYLNGLVHLTVCAANLYCLV